MMRFTYSPTADTLYIELAGGNRQSVRRQETGPGIVADFDAEERLLGIEILGASRHVPREQLAQVDGSAIAWLTLKEAAAEAAAQGDPIRPDTLRSQIAKGKITAKKRGSDWVISAEELRNYLERRSPSGRRAAGSARPTR